MNQVKNIGAICIIAIAVLYRLIPHPTNFSPINAIFLFSGFVFFKNWRLLLVVLGTVFLSDFILNNTIMRHFFEGEGIIWFAPFMLFNYLAFGLILTLGALFQQIKIPYVLVGSITASLIFFFVTNAGAWVFDPVNLYPNNLAGLSASIVAGIPFLHWTIISDLVFSGVLFGAYMLVSNSFKVATSVQ